MKKIYLLMAFALMATVTMAQSPVKFGIQAGVNFSKIGLSGSEVDKDDTDGQKMLTSFQIGALADIPVSSVFSVQPGLTLSGKGNKFSDKGSEDGESWNVSSKENIMYLEIPVNAVYKFGNIYVGAGPYAAFALSGKHKVEASYTYDGETESVKDSENLKFGSGNDADYKSSDFGMNILAGYQTEYGIGIGLNYGLGLSNIFAGDSDNYKGKNSVFSLAVRYMF